MSIELLNKCYELDIALKEKQKLQSNWNSLREWLRNDDNRVYLCNQNRKNGKVFEAGFKVGLIVVLDKMNELEGVDNGNNRLS